MSSAFDDYVFDVRPLQPPTAEEIWDNIRRLDEVIRALPPLPEFIAMHPAEWETFRSPIPIRDPSPWAPPPFPTVPVRLDEEIPRGIVRIRVADEDRDVPTSEAMRVITQYLTGRPAESSPAPDAEVTSPTGPAPHKKA